MLPYAHFLPPHIFSPVQVAVRDDEAEWKKVREEGGTFEGWADEYGVVSASGRLIHRGLASALPSLISSLPAEDAGAADASTTEIAAAAGTGVPALAPETVGVATRRTVGGITAGELSEVLAPLLAKQEELLQEVASLKSQVGRLKDKPAMVTVALANGLTPTDAPQNLPQKPKLPQSPYPPPPPPPYPPPARHVLGAAQPKTMYGV